jgi:hypothetical protein
LFRVRVLALGISALGLISPANSEQLPCGKVEEGHSGEIPEWPNEPVDFDCKRGFSELSLCILNREGIEWLPNSGPQYASISDGAALYVLTRENHPAYPMIVRREVKEVDGAVKVETTACGFGDKAASDKLIEDYKELDNQIKEKLSGDQPK